MTRWTATVRSLALALSLLTAVPLAACSTLPDSGEVTRVDQVDGEEVHEPPYFQPPGPAKGDGRESIVRGFLTAMEANPVSIRTARSFLTTRATESWRPSDSTLVYDASTLALEGQDVRVRLTGIARFNSVGSWAPVAQRTLDLSMGLTREDGEWRIDDPPNALVVGASFFRSTFAAYKVYYYDRAGHILLPKVVHLARGEQTATNLVRSLLSGPDATIAQVSSSAFPEDTELDLGVSVTRAGVAEIPVSSNVLDLSAAEVRRALVQLAWTLRAVPGISQVRLTVGGAPVPLSDGRTGVSVDEGLELAPYGLNTTARIIGVRSGRVVTVSDDEVRATEGPLGKRGFAVRSVTQDRDGSKLVAVSEDGTKAYAAAFGGDAAPTRIASGTELARPVIDRHGDTWLLDRTTDGARVLVKDGETTRVLPVPGISGRQIGQVALSPDGSRMVATLPGSRPRIAVVGLLRELDGTVRRALPARVIPVPTAAQTTDLGAVVDAGWRDEVTLAVLTAPSATSARVTTMLVDGSPGEENAQVDDLAATPEALLVGPRPDSELGVLDAKGTLHLADLAGKWRSPLAGRLSAVDYAS